MAQFRDILLGNPRNSQTQPDIAALAAALDDLQSQTFSTRAELIAYINSGVTFSNGDVISYDGLFFKYQAPSSFIADLPNWVPAVVGTFRHFGALGDSRGLLSGDIDTPDGTNDATAIQAFWTWLGTVDNAIGRGEGLIYRSDSRHSIPGTGNFTFYPENMIMDHRGLPNADGDAVGSVLALHRSGAGDVTTIDVSSINVTTDSNQNEVVEVNTAAPHGLIVGDVFMLHSDDVIAPGHDAVNERRGQFSTVKRVVDADTVEIAEPLYEALPSSPKINRYAWAENFSFVGEMGFLGPGRRSGSDGNPSIIGFTGPSFINCRDFNLGVINTFRIDYQALSIDNCYNYNVDHWNGYFDRVTPGTDGAIQYGVTYKNACTRGTVKKITATNGRHGAFDWTRNTNPGIGRNCTIMNIEATGCWRSAIAMHGNARDCFVTSARLTNCLDGLEIRSPGWTATDIEGNNLRYVVRLTDDPKNTVLRNIRGNDVAYVIRFAAGLTGYIGVDPVKDIVIDGVFGNEVSNNTVFIDASLPVFTQADGAVVAGTTTSMTIPDLSNTLYNNAGTMTGWEVTVDPDGAGTATEVVRVATHSRVGGNNVLSWSTPIGTAPVPGVATYTLRGFADDISVTNVKSRNCLFADIAILAANHRELVIREIDVSSEAPIAQPSILIQGTTNLHVESVTLGALTNRNKSGPSISSNTTKVDFLDPVTPEIFSAEGNNRANDTTALQAAVTFANNMNVPLSADGTYLTTASIDNLHSVVIEGEGSITRGSGQWYFNPKPLQTNQLYVNASTGSDTNDGLSASQPMATFQRPLDVVRERAPITGKFTINLAAGVYAPGQLDSLTTLEDPLLIKGPDVSGHPNVPTAIIDAGADASATGFQNRKDMWVQIEDVLFRDFTSGNAMSNNGGYLTLDNVHTQNSQVSLANLNAGAHVSVRGGIWDGNNITGSRGYNSFYNATHDFTQTDDASALIIRNMADVGMLINEGAQGHLDFVQVRNCGTGVRLQRGAGAVNPRMMKINDCGVAWDARSDWFAGFILGTGADENTVNVRTSGGASEYATNTVTNRFMTMRKDSAVSLPSLTGVDVVTDWHTSRQIPNWSISESGHLLEWYGLFDMSGASNNCGISWVISEDAGGTTDFLGGFASGLASASTLTEVRLQVWFSAGNAQRSLITIRDDQGSNLMQTQTADRNMKGTTGNIITRLTPGATTDTIACIGHNFTWTISG